MEVPEIIERGNLIIAFERGNLIIERIRIRAESGSGGVRRYGILPYSWLRSIILALTVMVLISFQQCDDILYEKPWFNMDLYLVGGFNNLEKY